MPGLDETANEFRWRLKDPGLFQPESFRRKKIAPGVALVIGRLKGKTTTEAQSIRFDKEKFNRAQAMKWIKDHKDKFETEDGETYTIDNYELPETVDIKGVEIFSGNTTLDGRKCTDKELEGIVAAFNETADVIKPYLKLGHDDKQNLAQKSGMPALGWVQNLRKKGRKIVADFMKVPKKVYELIKSGAYRRVSCEIFRNVFVDSKKKRYNRLLKAVSLLGADTPACENLDDIIALYVPEMYTGLDGEEIEEYEFEIEDNAIKEKKLTLEQIKKLIVNLIKEKEKLWDVAQGKREEERAQREAKGKEINAKISVLEDEMKEIIRTKGNYNFDSIMEEIRKEVKDMDLQERIDKLEAETEEQKKKLEEEKKAKEEAEKKAAEEQKAKEEAQKKLDEQNKEKTEQNAIMTVDKLIQDKHLLPADKDIVVQIFCDLDMAKEVKKYKVGDKEEKPMKDILMGIFEKYEVNISTEEESETGKTGSSKDNQALMDKATKYAADNKCSFKEALIAVSE
jgi:hypothetical protein